MIKKCFENKMKGPLILAEVNGRRVAWGDEVCNTYGE